MGFENPNNVNQWRMEWEQKTEVGFKENVMQKSIF